MINVHSLNTILGLRSHVSVLVYENYCGKRICVGGFYVADNKNIIQIDGIKYTLANEFSRFHWVANNLELDL